MEERQSNLLRLQAAIEKSYACKAAYRRSVSIQERLPEGREWKGQIEIFWLTGHPQAKRCFAWFEPAAESGSESKIITVLEIPPVIGPATALRSTQSSRLGRAAKRPEPDLSQGSGTAIS